MKIIGKENWTFDANCAIALRKLKPGERAKLPNGTIVLRVDARKNAGTALVINPR